MIDSVYVRRLTFTLVGAVVFALAPQSTALAGDGAAGQGNGVDSYYGSFGTEVPIALPAFQGLDPTVKLVHSSTAGNSELGVGWRLLGTSYIGRASAALGTPSYNSSDIYTLDGTELVPCTTLGGTHCTEIQNYHRITFNSSLNEWYVWRKNGTKGTYTPEFVTSRGTFRWALSTLEDTRGNVVNYNYWCDGSYECYLDTITYNNTTVKFYRELRPDYVTYATGGGLAKTRYRLRSIDVKVSGQRARAYELSYATSTPTYRSRLTSVQQFGKDASVNTSTGDVSGGTSLPAMTFSPTTMSRSLSWPAGHTTLSQMRVNKDEAVWFAADFTGDKRADVAYFDEDVDRVYVGVSNGSYHTWQQWSYGPSLLRVNTGECKWFSGDPNGDGKADLMYYDENLDAVYVGISTGSSLTWSYWGATPSKARVNGDAQVWLTGDFNGDGKTDLAFYEQSDGVDDETYVGLSTGSSLTWSRWSVGPALLRVNSGGATWFAIDVNGDRFSDVVYYDEDPDQVWVGVSNGSNAFTWSNFGSTPSYARVNGDNTSWWSGDFNGDGKQEIGFYEQSDGPDDTMYVGISTGTSLVWTTWSSAPSYTRVNGGEVKWLADDYNGDGRTDVAYYDEDMDQVNIAISDGEGFNWVFYGYTTSYARVNGGETEWFVADWDGDGLTELGMFGESSPTDTMHLSFNQGEKPDLVSSMNNGLGGVTSVTYTPSSEWNNTYLPLGMVFQTVGAVSISDGRGNSSSANYTYEGGLWSNTDKRFLGFRKVTSVVDAAGNYTETYYHQHVGCISKPEVTYFRNASGAIYSYSQMYYNESSSAPYTSLMDERWDYECNEDASCRRVLTQMSYDTYGNVTQTKEWGDYDVGGDERTTKRGFYPNTSAYIVGLPAYENKYEGVGSLTLHSVKRNYYDGHTSYATAPSVGNKTKAGLWNSTTGAYEYTYYTYDSYGNVLSRKNNSNIEVESTSYDSTYHVFPLTKCNAVGHCLTTTFDMVLGLETSRTDANGNSFSTTYDALGRPTMEEKDDGSVVTHEYLNYGNPNLQRNRTTVVNTCSGGDPVEPPPDPDPPPPSEPTYGSTEYPGQSMYVAPEMGTGYAWDYNMGHRFKPAVDGRISKLGGNWTGTKTVRLYSYPAGTVLATANVTSSNNWSYASINPVEVTAGSEYVVAVDLAGSGGSFDGTFVNPNTQGNIEITCAGTYVAASTAMPTNCITYYYGMADVGFEPLEEGGTGGGTTGEAENPGQATFDGTPLATGLAWSYNMGLRFTANADGEITQLGGYFAGTKTVRLYAYPAGTLLASANVSALNAYAYANINPVSVTAGSQYVVAVDLAGSGGAYDTVTLPQTPGNITVECSGYLASSTAMPTNCLTTINYGMADVTFVAGGASGGDDPPAEPAAGDLWVDTYFDGAERTYKQVKSDGRQKLSEYQDASKRIWRQSDWYDPSSESPAYKSFSYDGAGRQRFATLADGSTAENIYGDGYVIQIDPLGNQKTVWANGYGKTIAIDEKNGTATYTTSYDRDPFGNVLEIIDANGNVSSFAFDSLGHKTSECAPDVGCSTYTYNSLGLLSSSTTAGNTVTYTYDDAGRTLSRTSGAGTTSWAYDETGHGASIGRATTVTSANGSESMTYDAYGRPIQLTKCVTGVCLTSSTEYCGADQVASVTLPGNEVLDYSYDASGRLESISGYVSSISYDSRDKITGISYANGTTSTYTYDAIRGWLTSSLVKKGTSTLYQASYSYDDAARVTSVSSTTDSMLNLSYSYDDLGRLTNVSGARSQSFQYDAIGNMTYNSDLGTYSYGDSSHPGAVTSAGGSSYSYDARGNMTSGAGRTMAWNADNLMTSVTYAGQTTSYAYDYKGMRVQKNQGGQLTRYYGPIERKPNGTLVKTISAGSVKVARVEGSTVSFYHTDHLGSPQLMTNSSGTVVKSYDFAPYGEVIGESGSAANDLGFTGHRMDDESNLVYMKARYYNAELGRFISADSEAPDAEKNPQGLNRYAYAFNNPVSNVDPSGHAPVIAAVVAAAIGVAAGTISVTLAVIAVAAITIGYITKNPLLMSIGQVILGFATGGVLGGVVAAITSPISPLDPKIKQIIGWAYTAFCLVKSISSMVKDRLPMGENGPGPHQGPGDVEIDGTGGRGVFTPDATDPTGGTIRLSGMNSGSLGDVYDSAAVLTLESGGVTGNMTAIKNFIASNGLDPSKIHVIGHSLGGWEAVRLLATGDVGRVTALGLPGDTFFCGHVTASMFDKLEVFIARGDPVSWGALGRSGLIDQGLNVHFFEVNHAAFLNNHYLSNWVTDATNAAARSYARQMIGQAGASGGW